MSDTDDAGQSRFITTADGSETVAAEWNAGEIDFMPDPLTTALHRIQNAGHRYTVDRTLPTVTREMGERPRISFISILRTTAWPADSPIDDDPPEVRIPVCSCQDFFHRRLPTEGELSDATPALVEILFRDDLRCKHLEAIWPEIHEDVAPAEQEPLTANANPGGNTDT